MEQKEQQGVFVVDLSALELSEETNAQIARTIQKAVLSELASVDEAPRKSLALRSPFGGRDGRFPWNDWTIWGLWIDVRELDFDNPF
jgi:hypothetical protein